MIKDFVVFDQYIQYSGPFELTEFYNTLDTFFKSHHYDKKEKRHYEKRTDEGRYIELELEPFKTVSDYIKLAMNMLVTIRNMRDIEIEVKGKKKTVQQADISIRFRSFILKDFAQYWERHPVLFFFRALSDKFIYRSHIGMFSDELTNDTKLLQNNVKYFLNLYQRRA